MSQVTLIPSAQVLEFDSEFWGFNVARTDTVEVDGWARRNRISVAFLLIDADNIARVHEAERRDWRLMDVRVTLEREPAEMMPEKTLIFPHAGYLGPLGDIARSAHRITRFYADPRFPDDRCDDLYEGWLRNHCAGGISRVLVAERERQPAGYCSVGVANGEAHIGLIAVREDLRGQGIGRDLVASAVNYANAEGARTMSVVTQGRNVPALRLFERCGFRIAKTELWFHRWFV